MKSGSLQLYIYHSPFRPLKDWRRVEWRHVPATAVCLAGLVGRGRKIIPWATSWELCLFALHQMHNCSNFCCYSQVQRRQVVHYLQRALNSGGAVSSSALLQWKIKPTFKATCHMHLSFCDVSMTFHIILWQFLSLININQINVFDGGQCTQGKVNQISCVCKGLKTSIWGKASLGATWCQGSLKGAGPKLGQEGGGWWQHRNFDQQLWLHISSRQQVQRLNIWRLFVHRWPRLLHAFVTVDGRYFSGNRNFIAPINFCQLSYSSTRFNFLPNPSLEQHLFCFDRLGTPRNGNCIR